MYIAARIILYWVTQFPRPFRLAMSFIALGGLFITMTYPIIEPFTLKVLVAINCFIVFNIGLISSLFKLFKFQSSFKEILNFYKEIEGVDKGVIHFEILNENNKFTHIEVLVFIGSKLEKALESTSCPFKKLN
jgi:hypothetical protein